MNPDWKALCKELVDIVRAHCNPDDFAVSDCAAVLARASAALAPTESKGPTLKEISDWIVSEEKNGVKWAVATNHHDALPIACAAIHAFARYAQPIPAAEPEPVGLTDGTRTWLPAAALAQPGPVGPTDEELEALAQELDDLPVQAVFAFARAVLVRWGHPTQAQREPELPTDEELQKLAGGFFTSTQFHFVDFARAVLARYAHPTPQPIPVTERLPEAGDCDAEGRCWWAANDGIYHHWRKLDLEKALNSPWRPTHWLPAHALPLPQEPEDHCNE